MNAEDFINSKKSARVMKALIDELVKPKSIVDIGCGPGYILDAFRGRDVLGVDILKKEDVLIPDNFIRADLTKGFPKIGRRFDLVICLEVGEHLEERYADALVRYLIGLGDIILFSAAIPLQMGEHHVNEQWPSYWVKKFRKQGYGYSDCIRPRLWDRKGEGLLAYKQNMLLFARREKLRKFKGKELGVLDVVHPDFWLERANPKTIPVKNLIKAGLHVPSRALRRMKKK